MTVFSPSRSLPYLMYTWKFLFALFAMATITCANADPLQVRITGNINPANQGPEIFFEKLLRAALENTRGTHGDFVLSHTTHGGGIARDRAMVIAGAGIDVMWGSVTKERENQMHLISVDLL